ncbi:hypothetical protein J4439_03065 [Candidatus Woesearchaeota archaeon]|nr:hypothetical protein [Candidatus Woesearchaeota archaeon]
MGHYTRAKRLEEMLNAEDAEVELPQESGWEVYRRAASLLLDDALSSAGEACSRMTSSVSSGVGHTLGRMKRTLEAIPRSLTNFSRSVIYGGLPGEMQLSIEERLGKDTFNACHATMLNSLFVKAPLYAAAVTALWAGMFNASSSLEVVVYTLGLSGVAAVGFLEVVSRLVVPGTEDTPLGEPFTCAAIGAYRWGKLHAHGASTYLQDVLERARREKGENTVGRDADTLRYAGKSRPTRKSEGRRGTWPPPI